MADIRVHDHYPPGTATGQCYRCRTHQRDLDGARRERVVALGVSIDFEGDVALCETCCVEVAHNLGMLTPDEADALREQVAELTSRCESAEARAAEADELFASLARYERTAPADAQADTQADEDASETASGQPGGTDAADDQADDGAAAPTPAPAKKAAAKKAAAKKAAAAK